MVYSRHIFSFLVPLVLVGLIITSGVALYRVRAFALPISAVTATSTIILPVLTGICLRSTQTMTRRAKPCYPGSALAISMLLVVYDTAIATLAITHIIPPSNLDCGLDRQWARLFSNKNAETIKRIQDRHQCCGLHSVLDRAWPFTDRTHTVRACVQAFDRQRSCLGGWRRDEQVTGGLILFVAVAVFLLKLLLLIVYRIGNPLVLGTWLTHPSQSRTEDENWNPQDENQQRQQRYNVRGQIEEPYRDDTGIEHDDHTVSPQHTVRAGDQIEDRGPVMHPSTLRDGENEWREVRRAA